ncbi:YtxH domain-containing protein [Candidatus Nitronereus thalassa]|uniref:YtxH domain-containing protein n=1 Tax=Candidatus Nitronereus thalassa TaxID=3020898 RepID=A0ABU3KBU1_9BACT|nr:YtxH domain-containing protein [Candidatus Nitronereus thalassa]MDT7043909.1 YtxH domain-containing protein [Candidatus Nitronereus thalassa]
MDSEARCLMVAGLTFFSGLILGIGMGVLLAPQSGSRTRRHLRSMMEDMGERAGEWVDDAKETMNDMVDRGKNLGRHS